jgi:hypothetical protein
MRDGLLRYAGAAVTEIGRRLLLGVCAPVVLLGFALMVIIEGARGGGEQAGFAAVYLVWISFVAVPLLALANCWTLFGARRSALRLFGTGALLPLGYAVLALLAVQGPVVVSKFVVGMLKPLGLLLGVVADDSQIAMLGAWATAAALLVLCAVAVAHQLRER